MKAQRKNIKILVILILMALVYLPTFIWMKARFLEVESYYTHGFLVPFISLWLLQRKKEKLKKLPLKPLPSGIFILLFGLAVHFIGLILQIKFVSGFSLLIVLYGLCLYLAGKEHTKEAFFPIFFLVFMVPLPKVLIIHLSFRMKLLAAEGGTLLINWLNIPAYREGSIVFLPNTALTVGSPCSGLSSLISLTALGALFAYLSDLSRVKKITLFISAVPIALLANILRIGVLLWVAYVYGRDTATGWFHDFSGILVFVFALIGLFAVNRILKWKVED
jgi:exosortase